MIRLGLGLSENWLDETRHETLEEAARSGEIPDPIERVMAFGKDEWGTRASVPRGEKHEDFLRN
jgi:hypothetical protein